MKDHPGKDFYDAEGIFESYVLHRKQDGNPNEFIERPITLGLLGKLEGQVLDVGCGYGDIADHLLQMGAQKYTGIDSSKKMIALARSRFQDSRITFIESDLEDWDYGTDVYDRVLSRLVFHYIQDLHNILRKIHQSLKAQGEFVLSVEHPVITSSIDLPREPGKKTSWLVDRYFELGARHHQWMGGRVIKYHRSVEEYWRLLHAAGFRVAEIREGCPDRDYIPDEEEYQRRMRIPMFLIFRVVR